MSSFCRADWEQGQRQIARLDYLLIHREVATGPFRGSARGGREGHIVGTRIEFALFREAIRNATYNNRDYHNAAPFDGDYFILGEQVAGFLGCRTISKDSSAKATLVAGTLDFLFLKKIERADFDFEFCCGLQSRGMAAIFKVELERDMESGLIVNDRPRDRDVIGKNPWPQFSLHDVKLPLKRAVLQTANDGYDYRQNSDSNGGVSRSAGKTILGCLFVALGAALMKLAFYFGDTPRPKRDDMWLTWGTGIFATLLISQGTILALSGNWLP
jgi:hypothetical protein